MTKRRSLLQREPVRVYLYGLTVAIVGGLVTVGIVGNDEAVAILGVASAALAIPAVETARAKVRPVTRHDD